MWKYKNKVINDIIDMPEDAIGFIYEVEHIPTGAKYIGKKVLFFERNVKIGKREVAKLKEERKANGVGGRPASKKKVIKESDWKEYYGSSEKMKTLVNGGESADFDRTILQFVSTKKLLTYYEAELLFRKDVLNDDTYINDNILAKFYRKDFSN